jgi:hypothetical protein
MIGAICSQSGKRLLGLLLQGVTVAILSAGSGYAQSTPSSGQVFTPGSSIEKPGNTGVRAHTNIQLFIPNRPPPGPPSSLRNRDRGAVYSPQALGTTATGKTVRPQ